MDNMKKDGYYTGKLGELLTDYIKENYSESDYNIWFDHGDTAKYDNVKESKLFLEIPGEKLYYLSQADIVIARNNKVEVICEVEESSANPKLILGDITSFLLGEKIRIKDESESLKVDNPYFILGILKNKNSIVCRRAKEIKKRLESIIGNKGFINWNKIEIICSDNSDDLIELVKSKIIKILDSHM